MPLTVSVADASMDPDVGKERVSQVLERHRAAMRAQASLEAQKHASKAEQFLAE